MQRTQTSPQPLQQVVRPTTMIEAARLARKLGIRLTIASETFQHTGSYKFRAAYNVAAQVPHNEIITASSGNFGQAMAYACQLLGKSCRVVMPHNSVQVKVAAVREYGGVVDLVDTTKISRAARVAELAHQYPDAYVASAYDDPLVIQGNASLGLELSALDHLDLIVAPIGGGGLISGLLTGLQQAGRKIEVIGAEPALANDAARTLRAGQIVRNEREPQTIADGARTLSIGQHNWAVMRGNINHIVEVPEEQIIEGVRLYFALANLKVEPTGAVSLGAVLTQPELFAGKSVCCIVSGGNVDASIYRDILAG